MHDARYRSFLVRVWQPGGGGTVRVEVERIQSGTTTVLHGAVAKRVVAVIDPVAGDGRVPGPPPASAIDAPRKGGTS